MKKKILFALLTVLLLCSGIAFAQYKYAVDGFVCDAYTSEPIIGATVKLKGFSTATVTDIDGYFRLSGNFIRKTLTISYAGYHSKDITITQQRQHFDKIELTPDDKELE